MLPFSPGVKFARIITRAIKKKSEKKMKILFDSLFLLLSQF